MMGSFLYKTERNRDVTIMSIDDELNQLDLKGGWNHQMLVIDERKFYIEQIYHAEVGIRNTKGERNMLFSCI